MTSLPAVAWLIALSTSMGIAFSVTGAAMLRAVPEVSAKLHPALRAGLGYFWGISLFLLTYKLTGAIVGARAGAAIAGLTTLAVAVLAHVRLRAGRGTSASAATLLAWVALWAAQALLLVAYWGRAPAHPFDPFASVGSLHGGRYAGIAAYIARTNLVPILNQNDGQSLLASIPLLVGMPYPFAALSVLLSMSVFAITLCAYGGLRTLGATRTQAVWGSFVVVMGNTALSVVNVVVVDSGWPLFLCGYTDSLHGLASFVTVGGWLLWALGREQTPSFAQGTLATVPLFAWNMTAGQNTVLTGGLLGILFLGYARARDGRRLRRVLVLGGVLVLSAIGSLRLGGMLLPNAAKDARASAAIGGLMSPYNERGISIEPGIPFYYGTERGLRFGAPFSRPASGTTLAEWYDSVSIARWTMEDNVWTSLRIVLIPALGVGLSWWLSKRRREGRVPSALQGVASSDADVALSRLAAIALIAGGVFPFFFLFSGYKWELSRFLIPGYALGMLVAARLAGLWLQAVPSAVYRAAAVFVLVLITTFGPLSNFLVSLETRLSVAPGRPSFAVALRQGFSAYPPLELSKRPSAASSQPVEEKHD